MKKHYSSMAGTKVLDKMAIIAEEAEVSITIEKFTAENLIIALLGESATDTQR
jgi:hypothetical protein